MLKRIRAALMIGLLWGGIWGMVAFALAWSARLFPALPWHLITDSTDPPLPLLAVPGFIGGVLFSLVLSVAARHRRFSELSLPSVAAWGVVGGLVLGLIPIGVGLAIAKPIFVTEGLLMSGVLALLYATSAVSSLVIARRADDPELLSAGHESMAPQQQDASLDQ